MRERQSRRTFFGVSLGCAAPLLLGTPLAEAAGSIFARQPQARGSDPVLAHLRSEALRNYRRASAAKNETGRVPGEQLRTLAAHAGLIEALIVAKGEDVRLDEDLRLRVRQDGRDATVTKLTDSYRTLRESLKAQDGVVLPEEPDFARAGTALDILQRKGVKRTTHLLRQWAEQEAIHADRRAGHVTPMRATWGQKPGDDFLGYQDPNFSGMSCTDFTIMLDMIWLAAAVLAFSGIGPLAEAFAVVAACGQLAQDIYC